MEKPSRVIVIKGVGKATAAPDLVAIEMQLETSEPQYEATMQHAAASIERLREAIEAAGLEGKTLKTTSFNINTKNESYQDEGTWRQRFVGYSCSHRLRLEFDLDMGLLGKVLGAIAGCEANPNFNIRFTVKDPSAVSQQLLDSAVQNAKWKAEILARSSEVSLGQIQRIDYSWSDIHLYSKTDMRMNDIVPLAAAPDAFNIEIEPEDIKLSDTVTVVWEIEES